MTCKEGLQGFRRSLIYYQQSHNMTQAEFADFIGCSLSTVKRWESGKNGVKLSEVISLADKLGLTIDELLSGIPSQDVKIHQATGLSSEAIETLRHRDGVITFYLEHVIEPLLQNDVIACDVIEMASIEKESASRGEDISPEERHRKAGIKWGILETFSKLIDDAVSAAAYGDTTNRGQMFSELLSSPKMLEVYKDFGNTIRNKQGGNKENG